MKPLSRRIAASGLALTILFGAIALPTGAAPLSLRVLVRPNLSFPTFAFGALNLTLTGSPGRGYILQTTTNLSTNALDWFSIATNNAGFDGWLQFELPLGSDPHRFFRALNK